MRLGPAPTGRVLKKGEKTMLSAPKEKGQGLVEFLAVVLMVLLIILVVVGMFIVLAASLGNTQAAQLIESFEVWWNDLLFGSFH